MSRKFNVVKFKTNKRVNLQYIYKSIFITKYKYLLLINTVLTLVTFQVQRYIVHKANTPVLHLVTHRFKKKTTINKRNCLE